MTALLPDRWPAADGLSPDEVAAWLAFNDTGTDDARQAARLLPLLAQAAARQPGRMAVAAPDGGLCYRDLFTVAADIAARLQAAGVVPGDNVLIPAVRVAAVYPALLGVLLAGAAFVPVRPHDPADRLRFIEQDTGAAVALTVDGAGQWANKIRSTPLQARPEVAAGGPAVTPAVFPDAGADPVERCCYVIYTSGTTGRPKGVCIGEGSLVNFVHWYTDRHDVGPADRLAQTAPLTSDPSVQQIFAAWAAGACLVVPPEDALLDPLLFLLWLREQCVSHVDLVPAHWSHLLRTAAAEPAARDLPGLRWLVLGGESVHYEQTRLWHATVRSPAKINVVYGPTEATINATEQLLDPAAATGRVPIGRPLPNYRLYVLDTDRELCPPHVPGELYIAGAGLATGYRSAEQTEQAFALLQVFADRPAERLYRTGDHAVLTGNPADGWVLEFLGRVDRQVKISGYRVELEEVETAAKACPGVADAVVLVRDQQAGQLVCCYLGNDVRADMLRGWMVRRLPGHAVPHLFVPLRELPYSDTGKLDQARLRTLVNEELAMDTGDEAILGPLEQVVARAFERVLSVPVTAPDADFFRLGGSSLLAFRLAAELREAGHQMHAGDLLRYPTVATLAARIAAAGGGGEPATPAQVNPAVTPTTRLLLATMPAGTETPAMLDLPVETSPEAAAIAVRALLSNHPLLRISRKRDGSPGPAGPPAALPSVVAAPASGEAVTELKRRVAERCRLDEGRAAVATVLAEPDGSARILLAISHALVDGVSLRHLASELLGLAGAAAAPEVAVAPAEYSAVVQAALREIDPAKLAAHLACFRAAEDAVAERLARWRISTAPVADRIGRLPDRLARADSDVLRAELAVSAGSAVGRFAGLDTVAVSVSHPGRVIGGMRFFDVLGNTTDVLPLLVSAAAQGPAGGEARAPACPHWLACLEARFPEVGSTWPRPGLPLFASVRVGFGAGLSDGIRELANETVSDTRLDGTLEVEVDPAGLDVVVYAWGLAGRPLSAVASHLRDTLGLAP